MPSAAARCDGPLLLATSTEAPSISAASSLKFNSPASDNTGAAPGGGSTSRQARSTSARSLPSPLKTTAQSPRAASASAAAPKLGAGQRRDSALAPGCSTTYGCSAPMPAARSRAVTASRSAGRTWKRMRSSAVLRPTEATRSSWRCTSWRMPLAITSVSGTQSVSSWYGFSRQCASRSGMPASRHSSAAGKALWVQTVKITTASKSASAMRSTRAASARPRLAVACGLTRSGLRCIHGAEKLHTSSTIGRCGAAAAPAGPHSSVMRAPGRLSRSAASAGVVISTSPRLSRRTASTRLAPSQCCARSACAAAAVMKRPPGLAARLAAWRGCCHLGPGRVRQSL